MTINMNNLRGMRYQDATSNFFYNLCDGAFLTGLPNFWFTDLQYSKRFVRANHINSQITNGFLVILISLELGTLITQPDLSEKRKGLLGLFLCSHSFLTFYILTLQYKRFKVRELIYDICEQKSFTDVTIGRKLIKTCKFYNTVFISLASMTVFSFTINGFYLYAAEGNTRCVIMTAWPKVDDSGVAANAARVFINYLWWVRIIRGATAFVFVFDLVILNRYQFITLQNYYENLNDIFDKIDLNQNEKENLYLHNLKVGVKMHRNILGNVKQIKNIVEICLSGYITANVTMLVFVMYDMMMHSSEDHDLANVVGLLCNALAVMVASGAVMTNAGCITYEATKLATAMYCSGWQNCRNHNSVKARKLLVTSMIIAEIPVIIYALRIIPLSHETLVAVLKFTYSVFSVLY